MPPDILARGHQCAVRIKKRRRMNRAGDVIERLMLFQCTKRPRNGRRRKLERPLRGRCGLRQGLQILNAAQPAARAPRNRPLARQMRLHPAGFERNIQAQTQRFYSFINRQNIRRVLNYAFG